ncbi:hypothetical protein V5O48_010051 [Marasmius crinis-equi]|uniref:GDP/GTP exchange factor Sec2 N-terminal domain-containing protein n=1 Tax=Marasmius crinis-equi TaxID=585013 RepID=A0ABR3F9F8_9AGAR
MAQGPQEDPIANEESRTSHNDDKASLKSSKSRHINGASDSEAQALVIASLRSQVNDLYTQVTQLNNKLVKSYDRVSDLEDDLHTASATVRTSSVRISQLELERTQHLSALNTGLLVEKSQVTSELTRLMEKATEEAAQRGQAESARAAIEKDLDDLSASLFDQANTMVAEARYGRALSEQKVVTAEQALKGAEEAVAMMQQQMQVLQAEKEASEKQMRDMQGMMGKGKWPETQNSGALVRSTRLLSLHAPYQEFLLFVAHLRSVHPASPQPPAMTTLLPLPFVSRLMTEDSEPTLRLDFAPSLNWLSRRSVLAAIHGGQLIIEPIAPSTLLQESQSTSTIPGLGNNTIVCALCGVSIFPSLQTGNSQSRLPSLPLSLPSLPNANTSWSTSLFKRPLNGSANNSPPPSPTPKMQHIPRTDGVDIDNLPSQVHIFRISGPVSTSTALPSVSISSRPMALSNSAPVAASSSVQPPQHPQHPTHTSSPSQSSISSTIYPLCNSGWCLSRLRATCSLWAFVRSGIVEKVWEEEVPNIPISPVTSTTKSEKVPATPPKRRGLWGMATALQERAASWSESDKDKAKKEREKEKDKDKITLSPVPPPKTPQPPEKKPFSEIAPPPVHPTVLTSSPTPPSRIVPPLFTASPTAEAPPPLPKRNEGRSSPTIAGPPPPLPRRNEERDSPTTTTHPVPPPLPQRNEERTSPTTATHPPPPPLPSRNEGRNSPAPPLPRRNEGRRGRNSLIINKPLEGVLAEEGVPIHAPASIEDPAHIPLPESRPGTPSTPVLPVSGVAGTLTPPMRAASPAPLGGAPPPLPRRAMARGPRPMQPAGARPRTPNPGTSDNEGAEVTGVEQEKAEEEASSGEKQESTDETGESTVNTSEPIEPPAVEQDDSVNPVEEADGGDSGEKVEAHAEPPAPAEPHADVTATSEKDEDEAKVMTEQEEITLPDEDPHTALDDKASFETAEEKLASTDNTNEESTPDKDKMVYIGDATWEERTWKEVVRLKEVMFWARIGASRDEL